MALIALSIIIPTYKRPKDLTRLLNSISNLNFQPSEIIIVVGPGDIESEQISKKWAINFPVVQILAAQKPSVVHALNIGLSNASNEIVCFLDDDVSLPTDWADKVLNAYKNDDKLGAFSGRDCLQLGAAIYDNPPLAKIVGTYTWYGSLIGNHHCGAINSPIYVDVIKGANFSFRRSAFPKMKIESLLEGQGAEPCWEIDICLSIKNAGYNILYDNNNYVLHFASPRPDYDNRADIFSSVALKRIFNESLIMGKFRSKFEIGMFFLRSVIIGSGRHPGIIRAILLLKKHGLKVLKLPFNHIGYVADGISKGRLIRKESVFYAER